MRGNLPKREPQFIQEWEEESCTTKSWNTTRANPCLSSMTARRTPTATSHMGTAMNKVLKDIILKYKNMSGYQAPYVPGWDTHGPAH